MNLYIFRTNIQSETKLNTLKTTFEKCIGVLDWSVDLEDIDNVLRIEAAMNLNERDIINLVSKEGVSIAPLQD